LRALPAVATDASQPPKPHVCSILRRRVNAIPRSLIPRNCGTGLRVSRSRGGPRLAVVRLGDCGGQLIEAAVGVPSVRETDKVGDQRGVRPLPTLVCRDAREFEETLDRGGAEVVLGQLGGSCVGKPAPGSVQPLVHTSIVARIHRFVWQGAIRTPRP
jgi:hypothetical protein